MGQSPANAVTWTGIASQATEQALVSNAPDSESGASGFQHSARSSLMILEPYDYECFGTGDSELVKVSCFVVGIQGICQRA